MGGGGVGVSGALKKLSSFDFSFFHSNYTSRDRKLWLDSCRMVEDNSGSNFVLENVDKYPFLL